MGVETRKQATCASSNCSKRGCVSIAAFRRASGHCKILLSEDGLFMLDMLLAALLFVVMILILLLVVVALVLILLVYSCVDVEILAA